MSKLVDVIELSSGSEHEEESGADEVTEVIFCGETKITKCSPKTSKYVRHGYTWNSEMANYTGHNRVDSREQRHKPVISKSRPDRGFGSQKASRSNNSCGKTAGTWSYRSAVLNPPQNEPAASGKSGDNKEWYEYYQKAIDQGQSVRPAQRVQKASRFSQSCSPQITKPDAHGLPVAGSQLVPTFNSSNCPSTSLPDVRLSSMPVTSKFAENHIVKVSDTAYWLLLTSRPIVIIGVARVQAGSSQVVIPSLDCESWLSINGCGDPVSRMIFESAASQYLEKKGLEGCQQLLDKCVDQVNAIVLVSSTNIVSDPAIWHAWKLQPEILPELAREVSNNPLALSRLWESHFRPFPGCRLLPDNPLIGNEPCGLYLNFQLEFWKFISKELDGLTGCSSPIILVCGGKNAGKSTAVRFIINYLLRVHKVVQCLDCDLGQSELYVPGCLTMDTFTDEPVVGAPFTRLREPTVSCYVGEVTPATIKEHYKKCLEFVYKTGRLSGVPLVVNTMGWVERVGLELLKAASDLVKPNLIIELTKKEHRALPWQMTRAIGGRAISIASISATVELQRKFSSAAKRKLTVLAYLRCIFSPCNSLNTCPPYAISMSEVFVHLVEKVIPSRVLLVLLGAFVGLSHMSNIISDDMLDQFGPVRVLRDRPVCRCLGFGVIRGIDPEKRLLYIVTPVTVNDLRKVNVVIRSGAITTPDEVLIHQTFSGDYSGYVPKVQTNYVAEDHF